MGTTVAKAVLFDLSGAELCAAERAYRLHTQQPGWAELDPEAMTATPLAIIHQDASVEEGLAIVRRE